MLIKINLVLSGLMLTKSSLEVATMYRLML